MATSLDKFEKTDQTAKFPFLVLAVSILFTLGITYIFYQSAKTKDSIRFNNEVNRLQLTIENKINLYIALLKGGRGFIESNRVITRANFADYAKSLDLDKNYAGVQGIGYAKVIAAKERTVFAEAMKSEGFENFQIHPAVEKESYLVSVYLEPFDERNRKSVGFDMLSEANRREALNRARDSGEAASSAKVTLVQENDADAQPGFLIYVPIYKGGKLPASIQERSRDLIGYIYSPFRAEDFLSQVQNEKSTSDVLLKIFDGEPSAENLLAQNAERQAANSQTQLEESYAAQREVNVAGRQWIVQYNSLPAFAAQSSLGWSPLIFILGTLFSFSLFGMTYWETSARLKLQSTAANLFEAEQQKQKLLEKEQAARQSAEQANRTKDEFIAVVSHELRTPLNAIGGWTRILQTEDLSENTKKLAIEKIEKNLRSQTKLIEDLLDYSQMVSGTLKMEDREISFSDIFEQTFLNVEPSAQEKSIEFVKDNQLNGHLVLGDEDKLKLVIHNLLANAVKFTHSGGRVEIFVTAESGVIKMTVKDNGRGINPEFMPHIFDRFRQADTSSTRHSGGLGLGLTISHHIVKLHKGEIQASSEGTGKGTTLIVTVPHYTKSG